MIRSGFIDWQRLEVPLRVNRRLEQPRKGQEIARPVAMASPSSAGRVPNSAFGLRSRWVSRLQGDD